MFKKHVCVRNISMSLKVESLVQLETHKQFGIVGYMCMR